MWTGIDASARYSCGGMVHGRCILLPYAIGDECSAFAVRMVDDVPAAIVPA